jgi:hypothetical protein
VAGIKKPTVVGPVTVLTEVLVVVDVSVVVKVSVVVVVSVGALLLLLPHAGCMAAVAIRLANITRCQPLLALFMLNLLCF